MIREEIRSFLEKAVSEKTVLDIFIPESETQGHYSTNVAFRLAQSRKKPPFTIANEIVKSIRKLAPPNFFRKIEVGGNGFINFWLSRTILEKEIKDILKVKSKYGFLRTTNPKKIQIEFISANPTGPLTIANGRGGFLGDVLSKVLEAVGHSVEREYYINDTGNQIVTLGRSILAVIKVIEPEEDFYQGSYIKDWAKKNTALIKKLKAKPEKIGQLAAKDFMAIIKKVVEKKAGIHFNRYTSEDRAIHKKNLIKKVLTVFEEKELVYKKDGALWLKTKEFQDDKDRVLITSDGYPTYFLADAGHYLETKLRGFDLKINILGPDHYGYVKRIQAVAKIVGLKESKIIITQAIRLVRGKKEVKMSKRKGDFVTADDLINDVKLDAARFFFLSHAPESHMDFDLSLAKEKSLKNPVYYTQYAYVRAVSILRKAKIKPSVANLDLLNTAADENLILALMKLPEMIFDSANDYGVHRLTRYASSLAHAFHNFYERERVLDEEQKIKTARLALIEATAIVLKNLFNLLGITAPKKM